MPRLNGGEAFAGSVYLCQLQSCLFSLNAPNLRLRVSVLAHSEGQVDESAWLACHSNLAAMAKFAVRDFASTSLATVL